MKTKIMEVYRAQTQVNSLKTETMTTRRKIMSQEHEGPNSFVELFNLPILTPGRAFGSREIQ